MRIFLSALLVSSSCFSFAGTFVSAVTTGNFNTASSWSFTGDADGIPDLDDNITILSGHTITLAASGVAGIANDVTINAGGQLVFDRGLTVYGNYLNNGIESGSTGIFLRGVGKTIGGSGTFSPTLVFNTSPGSSYTLTAGTTITKTNPTVVNFGSMSTFTNLGNFTIWRAAIVASATGVVFNNGSTGVLELGAHSFMAGHTFNASAAGNTVRIKYSFNSMPQAVGGTYHHLIIVSPGVQCSQSTTVNGNLTINSSGTLLANNNNINIKGNFNRSGAFTPSSGFAVTFSGTTTQTISTSAALATTPIDFQALTIDNPTTVTLTNGSYRLFEFLTITQGTLNVNNRPFTFRSDATKTGMMGICGATANLSNANGMILERFISSRAAGYSDMASPVVSTTFADWDNELIMVYGYGPPMYYPSAFGYNESGADYVPVIDPTEPIVPGVGYDVYLDSDGNQNNWTAATINTIGRPNMGTLDISGNITFDSDGWNLVGNPYQANIGWDALFATTTDISPDIMFYDETIEDFVTVTTGTGALIAPAQGFWVNVTGLGQHLAFTEAIKSTSTSSTYRSAPLNMFALKLGSTSDIKNSTTTSFRFATDPQTALKGDLPFKKRAPYSTKPSLSTYADNGKALMIKLLNSSADEIIIPMEFNVVTEGLYTFEAQNLETMQTEGYTCAVLVDNKTGKQTNLNSENYQFFASKDEDKNRFSLKLTKNTDCGSGAIEVANGQVNINQLNQNAVVQFGFDSETPVSISVTDLMGRQLVSTQQMNVQAETITLAVPQDFSGIYLVNVFYNNKVESRKLFK